MPNNKIVVVVCHRTTQIKIAYILCSLLTAPPQKAFISNYFLEFVTYDRKMPKFFSFSKTPKQKCMKNQQYFSIITQILNTSKAKLAVNYNKSKCIQIQVHFEVALTLNTIALQYPTHISWATCSSLPSFMQLSRNYTPEVPLNNMHRGERGTLNQFLHIFPLLFWCRH